MEFTNDVLLDMERKKGLYNGRFANWYFRMYEDEGGVIKKIDDGFVRKLVPSGNARETMFNRGSRISSCCDLWVWNKYEQNKLLDLKKLNRCKNSRFCPNCKMLNVAKFIHEFKSKVPDLDDYDLYMLTLTIPSIESVGSILDETIRNLNKTFSSLNRKYSQPIKGKIALKSRYFFMSGGVRVLEITYSDDSGLHPHLHCIICVPKGSIIPQRLEKIHEGKWSTKRKSFNMKSDCDLQLAKCWTMLWYGIDFRKWDSVDFDPKETYLKIDGETTDYKCLEVDFTELDEGGIFEVFKYTFKSSDVQNYDVFRALVDGLNYKRIRQGFGCLYDLKCDDDEDGELQELKLEIDESPVEIMTREFRELVTSFKEYRKISRYNPAEKDIIDSMINED